MDSMKKNSKTAAPVPTGNPAPQPRTPPSGPDAHAASVEILPPPHPEKKRRRTRGPAPTARQGDPGSRRQRPRAGRGRPGRTRRRPGRRARRAAAELPEDPDDAPADAASEGDAPAPLALEEEPADDLPAPATTHLPAVGPRDSLRLYLREISRFPMLKPDEEHELALRVRDHNDPDAAFRLVSSHLRLVVRIAMDFQRRWMQNVLDLVQEGNVGLMRAVNKFDPDKGIKFSYYASFWIKAYILKFIMDNWRMVKIGTTQVQRKLFYNLNRERQKLIMQGFDPDAAMLSERLGVSPEQIEEMDQRLAGNDVSLNAQVGEESGGATRMDFLPALGPGIEDSLASDEIAGLLRSRLKTIIPKLNEKELYILNNRLLTDEPVTLREIGERYNVTRERVRQLETRLLEKIRQHLAGDIKDFSDAWIQS